MDVLGIELKFSNLYPWSHFTVTVLQFLHIDRSMASDKFKGLISTSEIGASLIEWKLKILSLSRSWWLMPVISTFRRLMQEEHSGFEVSLGYIVSRENI